ncbi:LysR family transcriptional regulator [Paraburkholderia elongata]|uniref:LysR family transcriptional regulator n=1 Tax=Paraburkholderia elongata TaxID=2675747 RepID=A0A972ST52_9BURK|nr:LysR family transcriptional regulator [Paraburkholderia elongata]NPT62580.1 LysR family transcriptional regulator [Paraburkholderia elongata]
MTDLNDVALFVHVVRAGSFAEAARRLGIPPNTASRRITQLEQELGLRLMQRSTRRLSLTEAGEAFYARCADQIEALVQAADELSDKGRLPSGRVRVAGTADFFNLNAMPWVAEFLANYPDVRLEFILSDGRADVVGEAIDVAIRSGKNLEPTLIARQLCVSRRTLVASPAYLAARGAPHSPDELAEHDCISMTEPAPRTVWRLDGPGGTTEVHVTGRFRANTAAAQLEAARAHLGVALLPVTLTEKYLRSGELIEVLPGYGGEGYGVYVVYPSRRQLPRAVQVFIDFAMKSMIAQVPEWK